jgi:hypothetical protein
MWHFTRISSREVALLYIMLHVMWHLTRLFSREVAHLYIMRQVKWHLTGIWSREGALLYIMRQVMWPFLGYRHVKWHTCTHVYHSSRQCHARTAHGMSVITGPVAVCLPPLTSAVLLPATATYNRPVVRIPNMARWDVVGSSVRNEP